MSKRPIIGIPAEIRLIKDVRRNSINQPEIAGVVAAGGAVISIPTREPDLMATYIVLCDGLLLPGGPDVAPKFYGEEPIPQQGDSDALLDESEIKLVQLAVEKQVPIFALCRGMQIMNVALGGTMYQDIESQRDKKTLQHYQKAPMDQGTHRIAVTPGSRLEKIIGGGDDIYVNSHHHQAVKAIAPQLQLTAIARDGVIEGVETKDSDLITAVQWHPEFMWQNNERMRALFTDFIGRVEKHQ